MAKNKKSTTRSFLFSANVLRNILIAYAVLASTLALFLMLTFFPTYQTQMGMIGESDFKQMVRDTQLSIYDKPQLADGRLFFPEMKLSIPANDSTRQLLYYHESADAEDKVPESASFASRGAIYRNDKKLEQIGCTRLADVVFNEKDDSREGSGFAYAGEVKLEDGRTMYIYQNNSSQCDSVWPDFTSSQLVELLKQAKS